mmetsp:Transcript_94461/g.293783  ORF Transcript_94461/g.293783 Transcript_94461/m.293783 type:complete len:97 (-) Transcript_94461:44-334(-)
MDAGVLDHSASFCRFGHLPQLQRGEPNLRAARPPARLRSQATRISQAQRRGCLALPFGPDVDGNDGPLAPKGVACPCTGVSGGLATAAARRKGGKR